MKRLALIADLHGNAVALEAVLDDLAGRRITELVCLGDVAAGGPQPREALARLRELGCPVVLGNADEWLLEASHASANTRSRAKAIGSQRSSSGHAPGSARPTGTSCAASGPPSNSKARSSSASTARRALRANASSLRRRRRSSKRCSPAAPPRSTPEATPTSNFSAASAKRSTSTPAASAFPWPGGYVNSSVTLLRRIRGSGRRGDRVGGRARVGRS
jgi:hypothetical protein